MDFLLKLPVWMGLLTVILTITILGLITVTQIKKIISKKLTKQHEKVGRVLFRVTAGLIALLISLSYANEKVNKSKILDSLESEAALIVGIIIDLELYNTKESSIIIKNISDYINLTLKDDWKDIDNNPYFNNANKSLIEINSLIYSLPVNSKKQELIKNNLINKVHEVIQFMQIRIYSQITVVPYLIFILAVGLIFMWIFFTVYNLDLVSLLFLSLYNVFIAILIYFVFLLSNPLVGPLKIDAHSFTIIKTKGFDMK